MRMLPFARGFALSALALSTVLVVPSLAAPAAAPAPEGVQAVEAAWMAAMKANDAAAVAACYAPDATLWLPNAGRLDGREAIHKAYADWLGAQTVVDAALVKSQHRTSGNLSTGWGEWVATMKDKASGETVVLRGRYTEVAQRIDGKWLYVADHASEEPAAAAAPAAPAADAPGAAR